MCHDFPRNDTQQNDTIDSLNYKLLWENKEKINIVKFVPQTREA